MELSSKPRLELMRWRFFRRSILLCQAFGSASKPATFCKHASSTSSGVVDGNGEGRKSLRSAIDLLGENTVAKLVAAPACEEGARTSTSSASDITPLSQEAILEAVPIIGWSEFVLKPLSILKGVSETGDTDLEEVESLVLHDDDGLPLSLFNSNNFMEAETSSLHAWLLLESAPRCTRLC
jgi:hypothetical protein